MTRFEKIFILLSTLFALWLLHDIAKSQQLTRPGNAVLKRSQPVTLELEYRPLEIGTSTFNDDSTTMTTVFKADPKIQVVLLRVTYADSTFEITQVNRDNIGQVLAILYKALQTDKKMSEISNETTTRP